MVLIVVAAILSLDQFTKFLAGAALTLNRPLPVIKGIFDLTLVHNRGAAFGILKNQVPFFIFASIVAIYLIYKNLKAHGHNFSYSLALGLILAGAIGNLIDRVIFGYVIDFLDFRIWPVFNVADSAITIGAIMLGWHLLTPNSKLSTPNSHAS